MPRAALPLAAGAAAAAAALLARPDAAAAQGPAGCVGVVHAHDLLAVEAVPPPEGATGEGGNARAPSPTPPPRPSSPFREKERVGRAPCASRKAALPLFCSLARCCLRTRGSQPHTLQPHTPPPLWPLRGASRSACLNLEVWGQGVVCLTHKQARSPTSKLAQSNWGRARETASPT